MSEDGEDRTLAGLPGVCERMCVLEPHLLFLQRASTVACVYVP